MVLEATIIEEKLIEAWQQRLNDINFSAKLLPIVSECKTDNDFRTIFTQQILLNIDTATSSILLQSYFKFHTRSGYVDVSLVIDRLLISDFTQQIGLNDEHEIKSKFLIELLIDTLKTMNLTSQQAQKLGKQLNLLAKWLSNGLIMYSNQLYEQLSSLSAVKSLYHNIEQIKGMLETITNCFLLLFNQSQYYCIWLMAIKSLHDQPEWNLLLEKLGQVSQRLLQHDECRIELQQINYEQILFKLTNLHLSEQFHQEEINFNIDLFNPIVSMLVVNKLHISGPIFLTIIKFFELQCTSPTISNIYFKFLQASISGYVSSYHLLEHEQRWNAYINYQLPRILAILLEKNFDSFKQTFELLLLHNEYILNRIDELYMENFLEQFLYNVLQYTSSDITTNYEQNINELINLIQQTRNPYMQQLLIQQQQTNGESMQLSNSVQILHLQRNLEKSLPRIVSNIHLLPSSSLQPQQQQDIIDNLRLLFENFDHYISIISALDQYRLVVHLLLNYNELYPSLTQINDYDKRSVFDLTLFMLCYLTWSTDDTTDSFGQIDNLSIQLTSTSIWLKKYWLARHLGCALFASSKVLEFVDFTNDTDNSISQNRVSKEYLREIRSSTVNYQQPKYTPVDYLIKTITLLADIPSLVSDDSKQILIDLLHHNTQICYGTLIHILLWLFAHYQLATDDERLWIKDVINSVGSQYLYNDQTQQEKLFAVEKSHLLMTLKRLLWLEYVENPLLPYTDLISTSSTFLSNNTSPINATTLISQLYNDYLLNGFLNSKQSKAIYVCTKCISTKLMCNRLLLNINTCNGIYETSRSLHFLFGVLLFQRHLSAKLLTCEILPYLFNLKTNEFMLEPNVYTMCFSMIILLCLEYVNELDELHPKSWYDIVYTREKSKQKQLRQTKKNEKDNIKVDDSAWSIFNDDDITDYTYQQTTTENKLSITIVPKYDNNCVSDSFKKFLNYCSNELFSNDNVRPVNYFMGSFITILWMFSKMAPNLKQFIKPKLVAQLAKYLPLQFPTEKVLSILDLQTDDEIEYASMVITKDYEKLQTNLKASTLLCLDGNVESTMNFDNDIIITKNIFSIQKNL